MKAIPRYSVQDAVVGVFVGVACLLVIVRSMSPLLVNSDASIQIGAALSLLNGEGFGTYRLNDDLSQPPQIKPLTWFAPGFSVVLFLLLKVGLSLPIALKLMYAIATIAGWLGWGLIFRDVMRSQPQTVLSKGIALLLAVLLPFYFTYDWVGTDLFLWASIPFIVRLFYLSESSESGARDDYIWIGCLVGLAYTFRYAAVFIIVAFVLFFLLRRKGFKKLGKIALGFGFFYGITSLYRLLVRTNVPSHLTVSDLFQVDRWLNKLSEISTGIEQIKFLLFSHLSHFYIPGSRSLILLMMLVYVTILIWGYPRFHPRKLDNSRIEFILCLNLALIFFLSLISFASSVNFNYLGDQRYYYPLFPSLTLIAYEVTIQSIQLKLGRDSIIKMLSFLYLGIFVFSSISTVLRAPYRVLGFWEFNAPMDVAEYPSNAIRSRFPDSEQTTIELLKKNPQSLAISFAQSFIFSHIEETTIRHRMLPVASVANVNSDFFSAHTLSQDVQAFLIFGNDDNCKTYCYYKTSREVELMKQIPRPQLVYKNEKESIRIFSTKLSKGLKFTFSSKD